jgi:phosphoglycerate dehydrogenase-like enzyme
VSVTVLTHLSADVADEIRAAAPDVDVVEIPGTGELDDGVTGEVLYTIAMPSANLAHVLDRGVRWIHTMSTGMDAFPLDVVGDRVLTCSKGAHASAIAEWVLGMMLAFEKQFPDSWVSGADAPWMSTRLGSLDGKTLGLVGLGTIGAAIADRALAFDMEVVALRRTDAPARRSEIEVVTAIDDVLVRADHFVLAAPGTARTRNLVDAAAFTRMKAGVHVVNIARGSIIDDDALRVALDRGHVAMASLDALEPEPLPAGHWMYENPRVRVSPHISWSCPDARARMIGMFVANLRRYVAGEPLQGTVNVAEAY